ncbi:hypothetical protein HanIR_Chr05g0213661 [Helianthus annuus]|nr:hypothetical protein HanIR_Chr05g0213661 [Helianthus annuus]
MFFSLEKGSDSGELAGADVALDRHPVFMPVHVFDGVEVSLTVRVLVDHHRVNTFRRRRCRFGVVVFTLLSVVHDAWDVSYASSPFSHQPPTVLLLSV